MRAIRAIRTAAACLVVGALALPLLGSPASAAGSYRVRPGDTLTAIARRNGIGVDALAAANGISNVDRVIAGRVLTVPDRPAAAAALARGNGGRVHRIRPGETLSDIARAHGTTVAQLAATNGIRDPNRVIAGRDLVIGGAAWVCPVPAPSRFVDDYRGARAGGRTHAGIDLRAPKGTSVVANVSGTLAHDVNRLGGNAYKLHGDDGIVYYGAHLDRLVAKPGRIRIGQQIGTVGDTGNARGTPPHLHFERRVAGTHTNPMPFLLVACQQA